MSLSPNPRLVVVGAASLLAMVLGSIHAFSVFLEPLERQFGASRSSVSLTYSLALVMLTFAVLNCHKLSCRWAPGVFVAGVGVVAAIGAVIAAWAPNLWLVWLGYSLIFGAANGLGYAFGLQLSAQVCPGREGLAMGVVTAAYAIGATLSPPLFASAVDQGGFVLAMLGQSVGLLVFTVIAAALLHGSAVRFRAGEDRPAGKAVLDGSLVVLWFGCGTAVAAGLMAIGHAAEIVRAQAVDHMLWLAPVTVSLLNMFGSFAGGYLADRLPGRWLLAALPSAAMVGLLVLSSAHDLTPALVCLGLIGMTYGAIISVYPAVIAKQFGARASTRVYGLVFTAWGLAGLLAPWLAGWLFDLNGSYAFALQVAAFLSFLSCATVCASPAKFWRVRDWTSPPNLD